MKKTLLLILCILIFVISGMSYIGLSVSEKYETQLEGLEATENQLNNAKLLKDKIILQKRITIILMVTSLIAIYPISLIKNNKDN